MQVFTTRALSEADYDEFFASTHNSIAVSKFSLIQDETTPSPSIISPARKQLKSPYFKIIVS